MPTLSPDSESIRVVPDWICEVPSKNTRRHDLGIKMPSYARVGIAYAWIVDIGARLVTVPLNIADWWPPAGSAEGEDDS